MRSTGLVPVLVIAIVTAGCSAADDAETTGGTEPVAATTEVAPTDANVPVPGTFA